MRIGLDATPLMEPTGGVARYTTQLVKALSAMSTACNTGAASSSGQSDEYWLFSDQEVVLPFAQTLLECLPNVHFGDFPRTMLDRRWWLWGLNRELKRKHIDLFHGVDFAVPYRKHRPSVMTLHDLSPWLQQGMFQGETEDQGGPDGAREIDWQPGADRVRKRTPRMLRMGLATMVITPTEAIRRAAIEKFGLEEDRVVAVHLAAGDEFRPVASDEIPPFTRPYFLFVGTLEPRKNIARLMDAWREVRKSHAVDLVLAGRVRSDFAAPDPEPGLHLLGAVPDADLPGLYSGAMAAVYPSLYEGFGLPVLEAMQCGALVITSNDPAIREVIDAEDSCGPAAIPVEATDTKALAGAMMAVAEHPARFDELRKRALVRASEFGWRKTAEQTREVYQQAVAFHARDRAGLRWMRG